jgi:hypothetical protein
VRNLKSLGTTLGLSLAALATSGWLATANAQATDQQAPPADTSTAAPADTAPADAAPAKPMHHKHAMHHGSMASKGGDAGNAAVEDLNEKSLDAAKGGKPFTPGGAAPIEAPKQPLHPMHRHLHHHMSPPKPADDAAAPAPDAAAPAPDAAPK